MLVVFGSDSFVGEDGGFWYYCVFLYLDSRRASVGLVRRNLLPVKYGQIWLVRSRISTQGFVSKQDIVNTVTGT